MAGNVFVNPVNPLAAPGFQIPGTHTATILHAQGGVTNSGLTLTAFDTAVINYSLIYPDPQDIALKYGIDYSPAGLTQNQHSVGSVIDAIQTAQLSPAFRPIATNLFYLPNVPTLGAAYDSLSGEGASASEQTEFDATNMFLSTTNTQLQRWIQNTCGDDATGTTLYATPPGSLPTHKGEAAPPACASVRTWRIWGTGYGGTANWAGNGSVGSASVTGHASGFGAGLDYEINPNFLLGFAAGGGASSFFVQNRATSGTVDAYHAALYGAWRNLNFYASGILSYDWFNDDELRFASIPGVVLPASNFIGGPYVDSGLPGEAGRRLRRRRPERLRRGGVQCAIRTAHGDAFRGTRVRLPEDGRFHREQPRSPQYDQLVVRGQDDDVSAELPGLATRREGRPSERDGAGLVGESRLEARVRLHPFDGKLVYRGPRIRLRSPGRAAAAGRFGHEHRRETERDQERRDLRNLREPVWLWLQLEGRNRRSGDRLVRITTLRPTLVRPRYPVADDGRTWHLPAICHSASGGRALGGILTAHPGRLDPDGIPRVSARRGVSSGDAPAGGVPPARHGAASLRTCHPTCGRPIALAACRSGSPGDRTPAVLRGFGTARVSESDMPGRKAG